MLINCSYRLNWSTWQERACESEIKRERQREGMERRVFSRQRQKCSDIVASLQVFLVTMWTYKGKKKCVFAKLVSIEDQGPSDGVQQIIKSDTWPVVYVTERFSSRLQNNEQLFSITCTYNQDIWVPSIHSYNPHHNNHSQSCRFDFQNNFHCTDFYTMYHKFQHYILMARIKWKIYPLINEKKQYFHALHVINC